MRDIEMRRAQADESDALAALFRLSLDTAMPFLQERHTPAEDRAFFRDRVFATCHVWIAERNGELAGICAFRDGWVDHLYVHPGHLRSGIGAALLRKAKDANDHLQLWAFQRNENALRFYESQGFRLVKTTDGRDNEEREPDALFGWERS
ncbi:MAG: GNAT family N-acetyltransferase [Candidatus Eremiobacteraeota bacterium]|nr:GNAT family N-acetyltransferase [Candidatus Eremiobacteraeota bacterium]